MHHQVPIVIVCFVLGISAGSAMQVRRKLRIFELHNDLVYEREKKRQASPDHAKAPWFINFAYFA